MTNKQILQKAIEKALKNGFKSWWTPYLETKNGIKVKIQYKKTLEGWAIQFTDKGDESWDLYSKGGLLDWSNGYVFSVIPARDLIFSHAFAKAFWGEKDFDYEIEVGFPDGTVYDVARLPAWEYHLQQIVLEDEPIKYLEKYV